MRNRGHQRGNLGRVIAPVRKVGADALRKVAQDKNWIALVERSGNKPIFRGYVESHRYLLAEWKAATELAAQLGLGKAK